MYQKFKKNKTLRLDQTIESVVVTGNSYKACFPIGDLTRAKRQKIGTVPTCSRRIFSPAKLNKVTKWKTGLSQYMVSITVVVSIDLVNILIKIYLLKMQLNSLSLRKSIWGKTNAFQ